MHNTQFGILRSLWNLFRGRKHNPLKQRIDSCDFDLEQVCFLYILFFLKKII